MIRSTLIIALLIMAGRVSGFGREWMLSMRWGAGETSDIAIVLMTLPDLLVNLLLGGAFSAAAVPEFSRLTRREGSALLWQLLLSMGLFFAILALALGCYGLGLMKLLAPGLSPLLLQDHVGDLQLVAVAIPLTALSGVVVAYLNSHKRFVTGASGTLLFNICLILAIAWSAVDHLGLWIAAGVMSGALIRLLSQAGELQGLLAPPDFSRWRIERAFLRRFVGAFSFISILAIMPTLARAFSSQHHPGALALFNYAYKLAELPMGVVISSIAIVLLPHLSSGFEAASGQRSPTAMAQLANSLRYTFLLSLAIAIPASTFSQALVDLIYFKAVFTPDQRQLLGQLSAIAFAALPFQGLLPLYSAAFSADHHTRALVWAGITLPFMFCLMAYWAAPQWHINGVMAAYAMSYIVVAFHLSLIAANRFGWDMLKTAFRDGLRTIGAPVLACAIACGMGREFTMNLWSQLAAMTLAFGIFMLTLLHFDSSLRQAFVQLLRRGSAA